MDQNRDGFIDKNDLRDTFAALGGSLSTPHRFLQELGNKYCPRVLAIMKIPQTHGVDFWFRYLPVCTAGRLNVKQEEIDEMLKEAPGPINFTVFLTMFGEKLKGGGVEQ